ncbi:MAG: amidase family protein [Ferrimicrobium sp.]
MAPLAHGNDSTASIRIPLSRWGLVALKVSRWRVPSGNSSWKGESVEGVLIRDVSDVALVLDEIAGPDPLGCSATPAICQCHQERCQPTSQRSVTKAPLGVEVDPPSASRRRHRSPEDSSRSGT